MATWSSGALATSNEYIKYKIYITENSTSTSKNTSSVTVKVKVYRTNTGYTTYGSGTVTCTINGTKYTASVDSSDKITSSGIYLFSKTVTIAHNADGTKTLTVSASIDHSRFTASTHSYSHALTTIPRKSSLSAGNGTLNTKQTLTISRASSSFTHTITYKCGSASGTIASKTTATSVSWTPPLSLASQNTSGTTVSVTLTLTTYSGSTSIGSVAKTIKCTIPSSVKPSCKITVADAAGYSGTYGGYLKGLSKLKITVTGTTSYGSAIKSYAVSANGSNYTSASVTTGVLKTAGTMTITAKVTDKRGRSASISQNITVLDYNAPQIKLLSVSRCNSNGTANDQGEYAKVTLSAVVTALSNKNTAAYVLQYKKHSAASYTSVTLTSLANKYTATNYSDSKCIFPAESGSTYDVILKVTDKFGSTTKETSLSTAVTIMHFGSGGKSVAFGKISEFEEFLECAWNALFYKQVKFIRNAASDMALTDQAFLIENSVPEADTYYSAKRTDTGTQVSFGVGAGGENHGIWSEVLKNWIIYANADKNIGIRSGGKLSITAPAQGINSKNYGENKVLWSGAKWPDDTQTLTLSEKISGQPNGAVFLFSKYADNTWVNAEWTSYFVPKCFTAYFNGNGIAMSDPYYGTFKYLYVSDTSVKGHDINNGSGTSNGVKYDNRNHVLRYIIGI